MSPIMRKFIQGKFSMWDFSSHNLTLEDFDEINQIITPFFIFFFHYVGTPKIPLMYLKILLKLLQYSRTEFTMNLLTMFTTYWYWIFSVSPHEKPLSGIRADGLSWWQFR